MYTEFAQFQFIINSAKCFIGSFNLLIFFRFTKCNWLSIMGRNDVEPTKYGKFTRYVFNIVAMQPQKFYP